MTKARMDGLYFLIVGWLLFVLLSFFIESRLSISMQDLRVHYFPARCLLLHQDPYNVGNVWKLCLQEDPVAQAANADPALTMIRYNYPPIIFAFSAPIALLPLHAAQLVFLLLSIIAFSIASALIWDLGAQYSPRLSGALVGLLLGNCAWVAAVGNVVGIAVSLCAVAAWCFSKRRFELVGMICLATSLDLKPHVSGLVWLTFLLLGGNYKRRALQSLVLAVALGAIGTIWVSLVAPSWFSEIHANMMGLELHGGFNDPGPSSAAGHGVGMIIDLQSALSFFRDDPRFYNPAAYAVFGVLMAAVIYVTLKYRRSRENLWFALAAIAPLTMLPFYHRQGDAKLLLLAVPACAMLWAEGGRIGKLALVITGCEFLATAEIPWAIFLRLIVHLHLPSATATAQLLTALQLLPVPAALLATSIFYIWTYFVRVKTPRIGSQKELA